MTIVTWNVNSIRVRLEHLLTWLGDFLPDVMCLQETKVADDQFPLEPIQALGYQAAIYGEKTYNGVAILSRHPLEHVALGFGDDGPETQRRLIAATVRGVRIVNAYVPNGAAPDSPKFAEKLMFLEKLEKLIRAQARTDRPLALVGDFNAAMDARDVYSEEEMEGQVCYHPDERKALAKLLKWGLVDQFRALEPGAGFFSWWDYRQGAYQRNMGLRIDHIWVTPPLAERVISCWIDREERARDKASDHVPVVATYWN
ncbi:MAG: exodeoxyribonuclease III [Candidatus Lambdaproteobacteria bacterium]|nr:exodeoxyribonuclease III [Candidatus Lambdaproteobacteria bacterium]